MSGAFWGETENIYFTEEKHETGYCLEIVAKKEGYKTIDKLTVPQAQELAENLRVWAKSMEEGGHYKKK